MNKFTYERSFDTPAVAKALASYSGWVKSHMVSVRRSLQTKTDVSNHYYISLQVNIAHIFLLVGVFTSAIAVDFKLGVENIPAKITAHYAHNKIPVALITNQTGRDQKGNRTLDILRAKGFNVVKIFAPEHGFDGKDQASQEVKDGIDLKTNIPVMSLYGKRTGKKVSAESIADINTLIFDIQDSGMRHYTYISTLLTILQAAAQYEKKVIILDRPNPLGKAMEGPLVEPELISFFSIAPIPLRHGMTIGEIGEFFNNHMLEKKASLTIVPMSGYDRSRGIDQLHAPLSPNIASKESCHGYCFLGLLGEIKPFNVGVGTPHAFQLISLPASIALPLSFWSDLADRLRSCGINATHCQFMHERKKELHHGLRLCIDNINHVNAFNALLITISLVKKAGVSISFQAGFDKAVGSARVRSFLMGTISYQDLMGDVNKDLQLFFQKAQNVFRYAPYPELLFN